MARQYFDEHPHAFGNVVSGQFQFAMLSCALSSNLMFQAVVSLLKSRPDSPKFRCHRVNRECEYQDCFKSLLSEGKLLLGVCKRFMETEPERVSITNPLPTLLVTPEDPLIVLVRSDSYVQKEQT